MLYLPSVNVIYPTGSSRFSALESTAEFSEFSPSIKQKKCANKIVCLAQDYSISWQSQLNEEQKI